MYVFLYTSIYRSDNWIYIFIWQILNQIMDTFDDKSHSTTVVHFLKPEPEDIATIKTKAKGERVSIKGVIHKVNENMMKVVLLLNFYIFQFIWSETSLYEFSSSEHSVYCILSFMSIDLLA